METTMGFTPKDVLEMIKKESVVSVDLKFMDFPGLWQHFSVPITQLDEDSFVNDLNANCGQKADKGILLFFGEIGSGLGILDHGGWVYGVIEDNINVAAEFGIVYKTVLLFVFAQ